jgi:DNA polymerase III alpha subunit
MPRIKSVKSVGMKRAFDIAVAHCDHQFYLANGLLTSNSSHSKAYSVMTMQCAHLATYHPLEFYAAVLTCAKTADLQDYVGDIKRKGIRVLPVDVNRSKGCHTIERLEDGSEGIRLALNSVLGVGPSAIEKIVAEQPYADFPDFLERSRVGKTAVAPMILVGAFTSILPVEGTTKGLEEKYEEYCANPKWRTKKCRDEWTAKWQEPFIEDYKLHEKVFFENSLTGFSLLGSPFEILDRDRKIAAVFGEGVVDYREFVEGDEEVAIIPVVLRDIRERADRRGQMMAFLKFGARSGEEFDAPCFSSVWRYISQRAKKGYVYAVTFNRKPGEDSNVIVGKPGFAHSAHSSEQDFVDIDAIEL